MNSDAAEALKHVAEKTAEQADKMAQSASAQVKEMVKQTSGN